MRLALMLLLISTCADARGVNKCVTPEGRITYSDKMCPATSKPEPIGGNLSSYSSAGVAVQQRGALKSSPSPVSGRPANNDTSSEPPAPTAASKPPDPPRKSGY